MRIAVFGDIHGNIFALRAVLGDLRAQSPDAVAVTGDLAYKYPWGAEVIDLLRSIPCTCVLGNAELYLCLWGAPLWPAHWDMPLGARLVQWERERLGSERLAWLASLPEEAAFTGSRPNDLLVVHGVPGNPFLAFLAPPGQERPPWTQTDRRVRELLGGADAEVVICGHTHARLRRRVPRADGRGSTLIANAGHLSYGRGSERTVGHARYLLLDWTARAGWRVRSRTVHYDPEPLHRALVAAVDDYPGAAFIANRMRPHGRTELAGERPDFIGHRWGDAPEWWDVRDSLPAWRALRGSAGAG